MLQVATHRPGVAPVATSILLVVFQARASLFGILSSEAAAPIRPQSLRWPIVQTAGADCSVHSDFPELVAWCQSILAPAHAQLTKRRELEGRLGKCAWTPQPAAKSAMKHASKPVGSPMDIASYDPYTEVKHHNETNKPVVSSCQSGKWLLVRYGYQVTTGGNDWTQTFFTFDIHGNWSAGPPHRDFYWRQGLNVPASSALREKTFKEKLWSFWSRQLPPERVLVSGFFAGATDTKGSLIAYPPLHKHHFHFLDAESPTANEAIMQMHGDAECQTSLGGVACSIRQYPHGYAMRVARPFAMQATVNDVRMERSPPMEYYFTVALRFAQLSEVRRVFQYVVFGPMVISGLGPGGLGTILIPGRGRYVSWIAGTFRARASLLFAYAHHHNQWTEATRLYVNVSHSDLELKRVIGGPGWIHSNRVRFNDVFSASHVITPTRFQSPVHTHARSRASPRIFPPFTPRHCHVRHCSH